MKRDADYSKQRLFLCLMLAREPAMYMNIHCFHLLNPREVHFVSFETNSNNEMSFLLVFILRIRFYLDISKC